MSTVLTKEELAQSLELIKDKLKSEITPIVETIVKNNNRATEEQKKAIDDAQKEALEKLENITKQHGDLIKQMQDDKLAKQKAIPKSFISKLEEDKKAFDRMKVEGTGWVSYEVKYDKGGNLIVANKADIFHATIDLDSPDLVSSVVNSMTDAAAMRSQAGADIYKMFENGNWLFDLVNYSVASEDKSYHTYWEEITPIVPEDVETFLVTENARKPQMQYRWELKSVEYEKLAIMFKVTDEFYKDFPRFVQEIQTKGIAKVLSEVNQTVLANIQTNATAFVPTSVWTGANGVPDANEYDAIMAMAAQVETSTYQNMANVAIMNTSKYWRINALKDGQYNYLQTPRVLANMRMVGNPSVGLDNIIVGDLKQYNLVMRGNPIIKIGLDGEDFSHNRRSVIVEQYFYNYIPANRRPAIVKGDFATAKAAILYEAPEPVVPEGT